MTSNARTLSASTLTTNKVTDPKGKQLGDIKDLMIDTESGKVSYAVLSFGGFLGMGDKYFAVPLEAMRVNAQDECLVLDTTKEHLEQAPGFDKSNWPDFASPEFKSRHLSHWPAAKVLH